MSCNKQQFFVAMVSVLVSSSVNPEGRQINYFNVSISLVEEKLMLEVRKKNQVSVECNMQVNFNENE